MKKLHVVTPIKSAIKPARKLTQAGADLWNRIHDEYDISDAAALEMLCLACEALDRLTSIRAAIDEEGELHRSRHKMLKLHPALKHELSLRQFITRTLHRLGLDVEPVKPIGRPGGLWRPDAD